ncbi:uncharacterized protein [Gossypium hirsutum]|uniref:Retrovirus-related Pol polyprotein from transposon TNT 1-94-like beta-barrel domain-containing protein n=1 Tax=Gossypium hirsutum TaxID=3635 RepID=A0A1U8LPK3_GOSHI|nr:uncharacterized protein LOC107928633 [Gossypium hirsutum]
MEGCDYWEAVKEDYEVTPLPNNPTMNQIKMHKDRTTRKAKAKAWLYALVSPSIFNRIMVFGLAKDIWDYLKAEYQEDERIKSMKVLNLIREFERLQMKEFESIKEYSDKLIDIANKYEATIVSLENTKDLTQLRVVELISALQAQEQRRLMRCWRKPDVKCRRCNLMGHIERFCKEPRNQQQGGTHVAIKEEDGHLFVVFYFSSSTLYESWLVDSGCTNHMNCNEKIFKDLDRSLKSRVRIGNGEYLEVKGKDTVAIESYDGTKMFSDVLFVPKIDQNLLSVGKFIKNRFNVMFEEEKCLIFDSSGNELFRIKMQKKSFSLNPLEEEQVTSKCQIVKTSDQMDLHAEQVRKQLEATLEAALDEKEFIEGEY